MALTQINSGIILKTLAALYVDRFWNLNSRSLPFTFPKFVFVQISPIVLLKSKLNLEIWMT